MVGNQLFKNTAGNRFYTFPWLWWEAGGLLAERTTHRQHCTGRSHCGTPGLVPAVCVPWGRGCAICPSPGDQTTAWKQGKKQIFPLTLAQPQSCSFIAVCGGAMVIQKLVDVSSDPGKSEYISRWEMVERTCWLFICFQCCEEISVIFGNLAGRK